jgi:hypothetical protein
VNDFGAVHAFEDCFIVDPEKIADGIRRLGAY